MSHRDTGFIAAFFGAAVQAQGAGLVMRVRLKGGEDLTGIPTVETVVDGGTVEQKFTVGHTQFLAEEVRGFSMELP